MESALSPADHAYELLHCFLTGILDVSPYYKEVIAARVSQAERARRGAVQEEAEEVTEPASPRALLLRPGAAGAGPRAP